MLLWTCNLPHTLKLFESNKTCFLLHACFRHVQRRACAIAHLICRSLLLTLFLRVFNYMLLKEKYKMKISFIISKFNVFNSISFQCTLSLPPKNIIKLKCFLVFPQGGGRVAWDWF